MFDWFTIVAQIINFLILVALLKYFLYGRIMAAMEQRQKNIDEHWQDAERAKETSEQEAAAMQNKNHELDNQRDAMLAQIQEDVEHQRHELLGQARTEVDQLRERWAESLLEETSSFLSDLRQAGAKQICSIARQVLADLADRELESQIVRAFIGRVRGLDENEREKFMLDMDRSSGEARVQSAFEIAAAQQAEISAAVRDHLSPNLNVRFEVSVDLTCGIALYTGSYRLAWELNDYLDDLERQMRTTMEEDAPIKHAVA